MTASTRTPHSIPASRPEPKTQKEDRRSTGGSPPTGPGQTDNTTSSSQDIEVGPKTEP